MRGSAPCVQPPSMPPATSASRTSPTRPSRRPPTPSSRWSPGCICGSDLWPYRGENDVTPGRHHRPRVRRRRGGGRRGRHRLPRSATSSSCRSATATTPARTAVPGVQSACVNLGFTRAGRREYARVTQADGSLVKTRTGCPTTSLIPSLLALSDVMATGWHAAVAAGVQPGRHRRRGRRRRGRPVRRPRRRPDGRRARDRDVAPRAPPGDRPRASGRPTSSPSAARRARRGSPSSPTGSARTPSSSASAPTTR